MGTNKLPHEVNHQVLSEVIKFGDDLFEKYKESEDYSDTYSMVIVSLFRKTIELSNGIWVCSDYGLRAPADLNFRGLIEAYLAIKYITNVPSLSNVRAIAYKVGYLKHQLDSSKRYLDNPIMEDDQKNFLRKSIQKFSSELQNKEYKKVLEEYNKLQKRNKRGYIPKWHSLFGGPISINQLIEELEKNSEDPKLLRDLYSFLSIDAHNYMALRDISTVRKDENPHFNSVCYSTNSNIDFHLDSARALLMHTIVLFTKELYPEYTNECAKFFNSILKICPST
ncbi:MULTISPECIES: DUF5677 domain-containing protein [Bacillus]|uniref:DUF5677 domain-containing protein n=1 Tax=Bacillus TaxID=1386 RepID=UPI0024531649|nr:MULTISPECIES: DUF5677 domain-containing protein [Bacillus]MDH3081614.1 DUF5677 domain-containing protein [Bacillus amyloliquefaciens]MDU0076000.1 DUF5677 domain-containing protein [Bacillus sp. IG2]MDU0100714.1 DUF5677 domain-containing protein [Bacillus sp. IS1]MEC2269857.1 DUF5677 domain-containing protein [Bacillus velezensis]MED3680799.1 DUF5677 domain-containing protein [Bacillus velezensis]